MCARYSRAFQVGVIGMLSLLPFVAQADTAEEFARAQQSIADEAMVDGLAAMRKLAVQNYAPAQVVIADYLDGAEEDDEAVGWYMTAANQGDSAGEVGLGDMYLKGEGVKKDPEKALYWIKRALEKGNNKATIIMAAAYRAGPEKSGLPVALDLEQANLLDEKIKVYMKARKESEDAKVEENWKKIREEGERRFRERK